MGVIETEYAELRQLTKDILLGKVDKEIAALVLSGYKESGKRVDQYLKVVSMQISHGKGARQIISKNIISEGTAIDVLNTGIEEKIKCPAAGDQTITRHDCLDYSGENHHIDFCQKCDHFATTRKQIYPG